MAIFSAYANYYELIYSKKNYEQESELVCSLLKKYAPFGNSILELGCGTGIHAEYLAKSGYRVTGIDLSESMLQFAQDRKTQSLFSDSLDFLHGDVRTFRGKEPYDFVISLFHVLSYQTTNDDVLNMFETARKHLKSDGIFLFDFWYGPAVLSVRPENRIKKLESDRLNMERIATPTMYPNDNRVDVNYKILIKDKLSKKLDYIYETHRMRYFFLLEIQLIAAQAGFKIEETAEWITQKEPGLDTWGVYCVARLQKS